jgi:hypothetical protein
MNLKMLLRILSISMALLFLGIFFPSLSNADITVENADDPIAFGDVEIYSTKTIKVGIVNDNDVDLALYFKFDSGETCGFSVDSPQGLLAPANDVGYVDVTYSPTGLIPCSGSIVVNYISTDYKSFGNITVGLEGMGVPSAPSMVMIDGQDTGVENKTYQDETISYWLDEIAAEARNHGQYVRGVALMLRKMHKADLLSREEMKIIMKAAAHANIPKKETGLEDLVYKGEPVTESIEACKEGAKNNRQYRRCVFDLMKELKKEGVIESRKQKHQIRKYAAMLESHHGNKKK